MSLSENLLGIGTFATDRPDSPSSGAGKIQLIAQHVPG
jgi:hypothetical protein